MSGVKGFKQNIMVISTGNEELDRRIGEGIPKPSFIVIEGENGSGKTTLIAQLAYGACNSGLKCAILTTEETPQKFITWAKNISIDLIPFYLKGKIIIYSLPRLVNSLTKEDATKLVNNIISFIRKKGHTFDFIGLDALSFLSFKSEKDSVELFLAIKKLTSTAGNIAALTIHKDSLEEESKKYLISLSDLYYTLSLGEVAGRSVRILKILKAKGSPVVPETTVAFEVDPAFGIKIVPIAAAKV
ncbi:MAG: flagellar accessory protein FlaH [Nitrososphaeria archaeon]|nr:flagellar accessory protein FlaH [Nitrososphaeria archaeon]